MVDITRCEVCGRTIPAIGQACPFCEQAKDAGADESRPYLPLALRLLLYLFLANVASTMLLAVLTLLRNREGTLLAGAVLVAALLRCALGGATLVAYIFREPRFRDLALAMLGFEAVAAVAVLAGWIPVDRWGGGLVTPLWNVLFAFLFFRSDVRAYLDPRRADHEKLVELLRSVERGERD